MKEWSGEFNITNTYPDTSCPIEQVLLFDIETTGFSAKNTYCYMIGYCYMEEGRWHYRMLFNDDGHSEWMILEEFSNVLANYTLLIHYNGDSFDIPYLKEKYQQYASLGLNARSCNPFEQIQSIDLYKVLMPYRKGLLLPNLKLSTITAAMGISRSDSLSGGELIPIYRSYLKTPSKALEQHLFQHNHDDLAVMIPMLKLLHFQKLHQGSFHITSFETNQDEAPYVKIEFTLDYELPLRYTASQDSIQVQCYGKTGSIIIPLIYKELRYYIENWKDYYYLPVEDTIIHKSVAAYVDAAYKEKAKKTNCYLKKTAVFLPLPKHPKSSYTSWDSTFQLKVYKASLKDKACFLEWTEALNNNTDFFLCYIKQFF